MTELQTIILIIPSLFSKTFKVNNKQTTDDLSMTFFSSRWNCFVSVVIVALIVPTQSLY